MEPDAPSQENGSADGAPCARCGRQNPAGLDRCRGCQSWLTGNGGAVKSGVYRREQPLDLRLTAEELVVGIVADLGGESELTTLERAYIRNLGDITIVLRLLLNDLVARSLFTPHGNPRKTFDAYVSAIDRFDRLAQRIGLKRRSRNVTDLARAFADSEGQS